MNLDIALDLISKGTITSLPDSWIELYASAFMPKFDEWRESGQGDYPDLIQTAAYVMLRDRVPNIDASIPDAVKQFLINNRFATERDGAVMFTHDLVRGYLAALYFSRNWAADLEIDEAKVADNWIPMLEFTALIINNHQGSSNADDLRDLIYTLLDIDADIAAHLFQFISENQIGHTGEWSDAFYQRFGRRKAGRGSVRRMRTSL